jgi:hypothetical protein
LESTTLIWSKGAYFGHSLNGKGEFEIRGGPTNKTIRTIFFYYGVSRIKDEGKL